MIYILLLFLLFVFSFSKGNINNKLFFLGVALIMITTCLRSPTIGYDTAHGYLICYNIVADGGHLTWVEPAWEPLNKLSIMLGFGYQGVIAIAGLLFIVPAAYVMYKVSSNKCISLTIYYAMYFVLVSYNMMRQMIAISFVFLVFYFYQEKKWTRMILAFLIGFLFHKSVLVIIPALIFINFKLEYSMSVILVLYSFIIGVCFPKSLFFLFLGKYSNYLNSSSSYAGFRSSILLPSLFALVFSFFFLYSAYFGYEKIKTNKWYMISLFGVIMMNLTIQFGQGTRIVFYFSQAQVFYIPEYLDLIDYQENRGYLKILFGLYLLANFIRLFLDELDYLTPYSFFFV